MVASTLMELGCDEKWPTKPCQFGMTLANNVSPTVLSLLVPPKLKTVGSLIEGSLTKGSLCLLVIRVKLLILREAHIFSTQSQQ